MSFISIPKASRAGVPQEEALAVQAGSGALPSQPGQPNPAQDCPGRARGAVLFAKPFGILQDKRPHPSVHS